MKVTDGTISNDLDKLEPWFQKHSLRLVRKPGLGVYIEGDEQDFRRAVIRYIYENMGEQELLDLVHESMSSESGKNSSASRYLLDLVDGEIIRKLEGIVREMGARLGLRFSDNAFVGLVVHLSLAVQRIRQKDEIRMNEDFMEELQQKKLLGARNRYRERSMGSVSVMDNYHLVRLARSIMRSASLVTGRDIQRNQNLLAGLVNHLGPSLSRIKMHMDIRNPLLSEMKTHYPELMELAYKSVGEMEKSLGSPLPEAEVAYIAMHLGAALADSEEFRHVEHRVVVACPTGMGTSRLLASRIRKQYANIHIIDQASTLDIDEEYLRSHEPEFIISTVPIPKSSVPVAVVSPMLGEDDMRCIGRMLQQQSEAFLREASVQGPPRKDFKEALEHLTEYGSTILSLMEHFFFYERQAENIQEACRVAGQAAGYDDTSKTLLYRGLWEREKKAATLITGNHLVLLHCKSPLVEMPQIGILHFGKGFLYPSEGGELVRTALVLLAPEQASAVVMDTLGYISSILLDRWGFIEVLHEGSQERIAGELGKLFKDFYRSKQREWLE